MSTASLLKEDVGRDMLGNTLQDQDIPEQAIRDVLQGRASNIPTAATVSRNKGGKTSELCPLCRKAAEDLGHVYIGCTELAGAQSQMHDDISNCLLAQLKKRVTGSAVHFAKPIGEIWPHLATMNAGIAAFVPDGVMIIEEERIAVVLEFARGLSEMEAEMEEKAQHKKNNYFSTTNFLSRALPGWKIFQHTYVMGIFTTFDQRKWDAFAKTYGMTWQKGRKLQQACVTECVLAGHKLQNTRRSRLEAMRMRGLQVVPPPPAGVG
jgi:hypothetical protein